MLQRIFSRPNASYYIIISILVALFLVYEMKLWYARYQRGKRFAYYNAYVDEINQLADRIELSYIRSSNQTQQLNRLLQMSVKKEERIHMTKP